MKGKLSEDSARRLMKKLSLFLALLMIVSVVCVSLASAADTSTREAGVSHAIKGTPTVDGVVEALWDKAEITTMDTGAGCSARFRTMWDENYIYLLFEVRDTTMRDDNGAFEATQTETDTSINTAPWTNTGVTYSSVNGFVLNADCIGFGFDPINNNSAGAPAFMAYVGLYGAVGHRHLAWTNTFYEVATAGDGSQYYKSWFETQIVRDKDNKAVGYIMEGKVDLKQHGLNFADTTLNSTPNYAQYGYTGFTYDVGDVYGFATLVVDSYTTEGATGSRNGMYKWQKDPAKDYAFGVWNSIKLVADTFVADNADELSHDSFFNLDGSVVETTPAATTRRPIVTAAATKAATTVAATEAETTAAAEETKGCKSSITVATVSALSAVCLAGVVVSKKRED